MTDTIHLTPDQADPLAYRVAARHLADTESWFEWEDYPYLDEASFHLLADRLRRLASTLHSVAQMQDGIFNIDSADLLSRILP